MTKIYCEMCLIKLQLKIVNKNQKDLSQKKFVKLDHKNYE